jgi:hypothetical protein
MLLRSAYSGQAAFRAESMVPMTGFCHSLLSALSASQTARFGNPAEISKVQHRRHFFTAVEWRLRFVLNAELNVSLLKEGAIRANARLQSALPKVSWNQ